MTASLANYLSSLVWAAVIVVIHATVAVILISQNDRLSRK